MMYTSSGEGVSQPFVRVLVDGVKRGYVLRKPTLYHIPLRFNAGYDIPLLYDIDRMRGGSRSAFARAILVSAPPLSAQQPNNICSLIQTRFRP